MRDGYCEHGRYVGGCGIDYMCGPCEMGISAAEMAATALAEAHRHALLWNAAWDAADHTIPADDAATRELVRNVVRGV